MSENPASTPEPTPEEHTAQPQSPRLPAEIGGYRIQRVLGSGGMATVYAALQRQPRRIVALKVMKPGIVSPAALRRFKREVEILGKLHHPYIAQVYDAGTHEPGPGESAGESAGGVPYLVMEYISGAQTILEYVVAHDLDIRERLKLFVKVCAAVEHGHSRKIIHRDLKPGNILIDQQGDPKVIDFGVARATELDITHQTMATEAGRLVGTIQYMSPEQLDTTRHDLDARCDVYALGALLYKLLTGRMPHELEGLPIYEAARVIREDDAVPPGQIRPELRGDLETIICKALERDRGRRYATAGSLGRDVVRYLAHKPIKARPASVGYRARLFTRRHRAALVAGLIVTVIMGIAGGIVMMDRLSLESRAQRQRDDEAALRERERVLREKEVASLSAAAATPEERASFTLSAHTGRIAGLAFSPAANALISTSHDHTLIIWDLKDRRPLHTIRSFNGPVIHLSMSADGSTAAASTEKGPVLLIDVATGDIVKVIEPECRGVVAMSISPAADFLAVGCDDLTLRALRVPGLGIARNAEVISGNTGAYQCVAWSADGSLIAGGSRGTITLWNRNTGQLENRKSPHTEIAALRFLSSSGDADSMRLFAVGADGTATIERIDVIDEEDGELVKFQVSVGGAGGAITHVAFDPAAAHMAVAGLDGITLWDIAASPPRQVGPLIKPAAPVHALAIDAQAGWCAVGDGDGNMTMMPLATE